MPFYVGLGMDGEKYPDFLEEHRFTLVNKIKPEVFLDYMRAKSYLDQDDCETVRNNYVCQTRRQKAGEFIDILLTKGPDAFKVFMDLLEWEYPHVFENICSMRAKPPPQGYKRHSDGRLSQALHEFVSMGFRERDLKEQKDRLQNVLEYSQQEYRDLERENLLLREKEVLMRQFEEKKCDSEAEIRNLKDENRGFMKKNIQLLEEIDSLNKKFHAISTEHESLVKTLGNKDVEIQRIKESEDQLKESVEQARRESQRIVRMATRIDRTTRKVDTSPVEQNKHIISKLEIIQSDLEAERTKNQELCEELTCVHNELCAERNKIESLNNEMLKVQKERNQYQLWLTLAERKIAQYFNNIQELEKEKKKSEEEKIVLQTKSWDVLEQKQRLFAAKHEVERRFEKLQQTYEKLKLKCDYSQIPSTAEKRKAEYLPLEINILDSFTSTEEKPTRPGKYSTEKLVEQTRLKQAHMTQTIRREKVRRPKVPISTENLSRTLPSSCEYLHAGNEEAEEDPYHPWMVVDKVDVTDQDNCNLLEPIEDHFGTPVHATRDVSRDCSIKSTSSNESGEINPDLEVFQLCVDLIDKYSPIHQWLNSANLENAAAKEADNGDVPQQSADCIASLLSMYIRSKVSIETKKSGSIPVKEGDILYVNDEIDEQNIEAVKVEPISGHHLKVVGSIPNNKEAQKFMHTSKQRCLPLGQSGNGLSRQPAIRRNESIPYDIVLPMKAMSYLPVLLFGNEKLILVIMDLLVSRCEDWACVCTDQIAPDWKDMVDVNHHQILAKCRNQLKDKDLHKFILIAIKPLSPENYEENIRKLFGEEMVEKYDLLQMEKECTEEREVFFHKHGYHCETVSLNDPSISNTTDLMASIKDKVKQVQESIFWLSIQFK